MRVTSERFLPSRATFRVGSASESQWMVLTWLAGPPPPLTLEALDSAKRPPIHAHTSRSCINQLAYLFHLILFSLFSMTCLENTQKVVLYRGVVFSLI